MEGYKRYLLYLELFKLANEFAASADIKSMYNIFVRVLGMVDSYNNIEFLKDLLYIKITIAGHINNNVELKSLVDKFFYAIETNKKINVELPDIKNIKYIQNDNMMTVEYNNIIFNIPKFAYDIYKKYVNDGELLKINMFYFGDLNRKNKKICDNNIIENIIDICKPKNITELSFNFVEASFLEVAEKYKNIHYSLHTFNPKINEPFLATDYYLSDKFTDNNIIYITNLFDQATSFYLFNDIIPKILNSRKNILIVILVNFITSMMPVYSLLESLDYIKYNKTMELYWLDITNGTKYKLEGRLEKCYMACSKDFSKTSFDKITHMIDNYK